MAAKTVRPSGELVREVTAEEVKDLMVAFLKIRNELVRVQADVQNTKLSLEAAFEVKLRDKLDELRTTFQEKIIALRKQHVEAVEELRARFRQELDDAKRLQEVTLRSKHRQALERPLNDAHAKIEELTRQLQEKDTIIAEQKERLEKAETDLQNRKIQVFQYKSSAERATDALQKAAQDVYRAEVLQKEVIQKNKEIALLTKRLNDYNAKIRQYQTQYRIPDDGSLL